MLAASIPIACGVLLSLLFTAFKTFVTENPTCIPSRLVLIRALPGFVLFFLSYFVLASAEHELISILMPPSLIPPQAERWAVLVGLGALSPLIMLVKSTPTTRKYIPKAVFRALQVFDEVTRLYLLRMISREERKAHYEMVRGDRNLAECAIDRVYELHVIDIILRIHKRDKKIDPETVLGLRRVRPASVKSKFLFQHFGYDDCRKIVRLEIATPTTLCASWPVGQPDRRHSKDRRQSSVPSRNERRIRSEGRRRTDALALESLILDAAEA